MLSFLKKKCTVEVNGTILGKKRNEGFWFIEVGYSVDGRSYTVTEQLTYHTVDTYKIGKISVGASYCPAISNLSIGESIRVCYDPRKPKRAYLPENNGCHIS